MSMNKKQLMIDRLACYGYSIETAHELDAPLWYELTKDERNVRRAAIVACLEGRFGPTMKAHRPHDQGVAQ
jgi:hypothetical protein